MRPRSRKNVMAEQVGDEVVVYDDRTHEAHRLNPTAAFVWRTADGQRSVADLAADLRRAFADVDGPDAEDLVRLSLHALGRANLLQDGSDAGGDGWSRRDLLRLSAALLPVVATVMVPEPLSAGLSQVPTIDTQPLSQAIDYNTSITLSVVAHSNDARKPLSYQWYQGAAGFTTTPMAGATGASFTTPNLTVTTNYWVQVSELAGQSLNSVTATITVAPGPTPT